MFEHLDFWWPWSHITNTLLSQDIIFTYSNTTTSFMLQVVTDLKRKQMKIIYLLTVALSCSSAAGSLLPCQLKKVEEEIQLEGQSHEGRVVRPWLAGARLQDWKWFQHTSKMSTNIDPQIHTNHNYRICLGVTNFHLLRELPLKYFTLIMLIMR